jgi:hypothetical protein
VLFSRDQVATFVNQNYEAAWESVRPVPIVKIDFGNGTVLTRTLHGNIASYVCNADGHVLDVIPGIYTPDVYVKRLNELRLLAGWVRALSPEKGDEFVKNYHAAQAEGKAAPVPAPRLDVGKTVAIEAPVVALVNVRNAVPVAPNGPVAPPNGGVPAKPVPPAVAAAVRADKGKGKIERPVEALIAARAAAMKAPQPAPVVNDSGLIAAEDLASWNLLREDTQGNETVRRKQIHALLAKSGKVKPATITKPIYKDILHADLDDPYLGLGPTLFGSYPFSKEEARK